MVYHQYLHQYVSICTLESKLLFGIIWYDGWSTMRVNMENLCNFRFIDPFWEWGKGESPRRRGGGTLALSLLCCLSLCLCVHPSISLSISSYRPTSNGGEARIDTLLFTVTENILSAETHVWRGESQHQYSYYMQCTILIFLHDAFV